MGTSKPRIKLKSHNNVNDTYMTPKENEHPEINEKTELPNSSSKKMEENAAKKNDAAKQKENKQTDTLGQTKLTDVSETISKVLSISAVFGVILGGVVTYIYLNSIGQLSIFPELINNASSFIAISIWFIFQTFLIFLVFLLTHHLVLQLKKDIDIFTKILYVISIIIFCLFLSLFLIYLTSNLYDEQWGYILFIIIIFYAVCIFMFSSMYSNKKDKKNRSIVIFLFTLLIMVFSILLDLSDLLNDKKSILSVIRFVETPQNSSWYLLHNNFQQNDGFQETNGINKSDLKKGCVLIIR